VIGFQTGDERNQWMQYLKDNRTKPIPPLPSHFKVKIRQSRSMALKKNISGSVATTSGGKSLIKEFLGKDAVDVINIVKSLITTYENKKKSK